MHFKALDADTESPLERALQALCHHLIGSMNRGDPLR
jgi:hypothetical protein